MLDFNCSTGVVDVDVRTYQREWIKDAAVVIDTDYHEGGSEILRSKG